MSTVDPSTQWGTGATSPESSPPPTEPAAPTVAPSEDPVMQAAAAPERMAGIEAEYKAALEGLQQKFADLEQLVSSGQLTATPPDAVIQAKVDDLRAVFADWPVEGGKLEGVPDDEDGKPVHPWNLRDLGLPVPGVTRDFLPPGPNLLAPIVVSHSHGTLIPGTAGTEVEALGSLLGRVGYPNSISRGVNHAFAFDESLLAAVQSFRRDYHVQEDPSGFPPDHRPEIYVGPWTWEAIERVAARGA